MRAKWISYAIGAVALIAAGFYVFIYLYRWEWNRAIMAGVLFIAAEIGLVAALVLDRLKKMEERIKEHGIRRPDLATLQDIEAGAPEPRRHFAWLTDQAKVGVFVPVLMGAGVVISGIAWCVERLAASTARPLLERRLAMRLAPLGLPEGGLTGTASIAVSVAPSSKRHVYKRMFVGLLLVTATMLGIDALGDLTQDRPDLVTGGSTTMTLDISVRDADLGGTMSAAQTLWFACRGTVSNELTDLSASGAGRVSMEFEPALGKYSTRRLTGCFEDGTVDGLKASLID